MYKRLIMMTTTKDREPTLKERKEAIEAIRKKASEIKKNMASTGGR
jgi:hypothetical protein